KSQRGRDGLGCSGRIAIGKHHHQAAKYRITIRAKHPILTSRRLAQAKKRFAVRRKPLRKLCGPYEITRCRAGAKIDNERVHLFVGEIAETFVQRLKISAV